MHLLGKIAIVAGILLVVVGLIIYFWGNKLGWIGHLPGDFRMERENFKLYFPITTMIILSLLLSIIIKLFQRFLDWEKVKI